MSVTSGDDPAGLGLAADVGGGEAIASIEGDVPVGQQQRSNSRVGVVASWLFLVVLALYFLFPFFAIARFSLQRVPVVLLGANNLFDRWTLEGVREVFRDPQFGTALRFSVMFAVATVVLALVLMLPTAMWVELKVPQARSLVETLTVLPYMVPPIALVVGVAGAYKDAVPWFFNSRFVLIPFYAVLAMPFTYRALDAGLRAIDLRTLVDASRSLGAGWTTTFFRVLVPNMRVAILTSSFLTATVVLGEFTMASILGFSFPDRITLPVFTQVLGAQSPFAGYAVGLMTLIASVILLATLTFITGRRGAAAAARGI